MSVNPLYANFNIMHLAFNCEIVNGGTRKNYYVYLLFYPFP